MFERHFGLRENPFHSGHQLRFLYPSREHQEARAHLRYGIENREPFVLITGEVGTGKTTALYDALAEWGSKVSVALVTNSALTREEMIEEICLRFGLPLASGASKPQALAQLERHLLAVRNRGEHAVLLLDEAQNLAPELLEEIRLLSNLETQGERLVQIFLVGQPELEAKLTNPNLRQLRQRISVHYRLNPLSPEETAGYIHHRISVAGGNPWAAFPPEACREVYRVTHGIPREINTVATQAMITAFTENEPSVSRAHVQAVARENDFHSVLGGPLEMPDEATWSTPPVAAQAAPVQAVPEVAVPAPAAPIVATPVVATPAEANEAPAWSPPELEPAPVASQKPTQRSELEPELREELDAWSRAAFGLLEARRNRAPEPEPAAPAPAHKAPRSVLSAPATAKSAPAPEHPAPVREYSAPAPERRFPTRAELRAHSEHADPGNADLSELPARLREKIANDIANEERPHRSTPIVLAAVAVAAIAFGLVLSQRFQVIDVPFMRPIAGMPSTGKPALIPARVALVAPGRSTVAVDNASTRTDTTSTSPNAVPTRNVEPAPSASATPAVPLKTPTTAALKPTPANKSAGPDTLVFGISVGSYLDRDRARAERDLLSARTGLPGQVIPFSSSGTTMFRIVLGRYPSNAAATRAASEFVETYGVDEAQPVLISRTHPK